MMDDGYRYCPVCQVVLPTGHDRVRKTHRHVKSHSFWSLFKALRALRARTEKEHTPEQLI